MKYIQKNIEIDTSGHINQYWECDFTTVDLSQLTSGGFISVFIRGCKDLSSRQLGKHFSDQRRVTVTNTDLELSGSIGYANISKLYEVLTTKEITETYYEDELDAEGGFIGSIEKTRQIPAYPDFFDGQIIDIQ